MMRIKNNPQYDAFVLEADSQNPLAIKRYASFGFAETVYWPKAMKMHDRSS